MESWDTTCYYCRFYNEETGTCEYDSFWEGTEVNEYGPCIHWVDDFEVDKERWT